MYEILLTRVFSVTTWYHFAFFAVSVAMFGMTVGALIIYLAPNHYSQRRATHQLCLTSLLFGISVPISLLTHLHLPFMITEGSLVGVCSVVLNYVAISIPFIFGGMAICIALTKLPQQVTKLYAADLAGAATGCMLLIYILDFTDAPTAVLIVAFCASLASVFFAACLPVTKLSRSALIITVVFASVASAHGFLSMRNVPLLRITWVKGQTDHRRPLYEKWNSFSYVRVFGDPNKLAPPAGPISGPYYPISQKVKQLYLDIDGSALTLLTNFNGDEKQFDFLRYDIANLAHYLRRNAAVMVVGAGGGKDILSALVFQQRSVVGVEINKHILDAVNMKFGDFTGHLDKHPKVTFVNDEARSYIARQKTNFDIIQVSLIDTWAATAAGAFALTENSIYTVEGWKVFLEHLAPQGILTFTRWYFRQRPAELYRVTSLARKSLGQMGIQNVRNHIAIITKTWKSSGKVDEPDGIGTILVSKQPFSKVDISTLEETSLKMGFDILLSPNVSLDPTFARIASEEDLTMFYDKFPFDISPPTDDNPFFFNMLRLRDTFNPHLWREGVSFNNKAVVTLGTLLFVVLSLTFLCIVIPLKRTTEKSTLKGAFPLLVFFGCIGLGYMLIEISQMQRLIIFLGHPTYGLSVVLFALLLSTGLGSYFTRSTASGINPLLVLLCVLALFGLITPYVIRTFEASTTPIRILLATGILFPIGFFMGMPFPIGMGVGVAKSPALTPWLWGINGAASVCASVFAVGIALTASIPAAFWTGVGCYLLALIALHKATKDRASKQI